MTVPQPNVIEHAPRRRATLAAPARSPQAFLIEAFGFTLSDGSLLELYDGATLEVGVGTTQTGQAQAPVRRTEVAV